MRKRAFMLILTAAVLMACGDSSTKAPKEHGGKPVVMTTFYPTLYFVERIAGDLVSASCPVPEDQDAIFWEPDDATVERYQKADLIVVNGAEFEKWVLTTSLPEAKIVNTAKPFESEFLKFEHAVTHSHGPEGKHSHVGIDGHTWLDPVNAKVQAGAIHKALVRLLPKEKEKLDAGFAALTKDLDGLDAAFRAFAGKGPVLASHPAYNYVARRYGWTVENLNLDPEEMPEDEVFAQAKGILEKVPAKFLLWESDPLPEIAKRFLTELGLTSVTFSPCELMGKADLDAGEDYLSVMKANLERLRPVFASED